MRIALSIITVSTLLTTACVDEPLAPEAATPEEAVALLADRGELSSPIEPGFDQVAAEDARRLLGRFVKLMFGLVLDPIERLKCNNLNMSREQITVLGCTYTLSNEECEASWSEADNEYVCECDVYVIGATGSGC